MRRAAGQAAAHVGRLVHRLAHIAMAICVLLAVVIGILAWRLSQGPLDMEFLAQRLEAAVNDGAGPTRLSIGGAALAWEGFSKGVDRPLDLRLRNIAVTDGKGVSRARIPRVEVSLSVGWLLLGRIVPRAIAVDGARLRATRAADGEVRLDLGTPDEPQAASPDQPADSRNPGETWSSLLGELSLPPETDHGDRASRWSQLQRVDIRNAAVVMDDRQLGLQWRAPLVDIDLRRASDGGMQGSTTIALALGNQQAQLTVQARLLRDGTAIEAQLSQIRPADIAANVPSLISLAALDAPLTLSGRAELDANLAVKTLEAKAEIGKGVVKIGAGQMPLESALVEAQGTATTLDIALRQLVLLGHDGGKPTTLTGQVQARRDGAAVLADVTLDLDQVAFADLPHLWPVGVGGKGTRPWITENITAGTASNGHVALGLRIGADFNDVEATSLEGGMEGHDVTVSWLRPVPPILHGEALLKFRGPDAMDILVQSGAQSGGAVVLHGGKVTLTGLATTSQFADIDVDLAGPVADVLAILKNPRVKLLDRRPVPMRDPRGQLTGHLSIAHLPMKDNVSVDDIQIRAVTHLTEVHLGGVAAGHDLDHGNFDLSAGNDGLKLNGAAQVAGIPAQLQVAMDFRSGPPNEVLQDITVSATIDARQLAANGLDTMGIITGGNAAVQVNMRTRRDDHSDISARADLGPTGLSLAPLGWTKPAGRPLVAQTHLLLDHDRLVGIDRLDVSGEGADIHAQMDFVDGKPSVTRLQRLALGSTTDVHGEFRLPHPAAPGRPAAGWFVKLAGPSLDLSAQMKHGTDRKPAKAKQDDGTLPAGSVDVALDRVQLGDGRMLTGVILRGESDGQSIREARLSGRTSPADPFDLSITPGPAGRKLAGTAADTGTLLRAFGVTSDVEGGTLTLSGQYNDSAGKPGDRLSGQAQISNFRLRNAPIVAKLLQAMTLYGVLEAIQGPGLGVSGVIAPFSLTGDVLELSDARAFSASLGATVKGYVNIAASTCELQGTIVPAYFFNTLPGKIPLIGRIFSPESGGGLFAATYGVHGSCDDPSISVNPLATLTPGFLRGIFGIFD